MKVHELKTINPHFHDIWIGLKNFELRKNDRGFKVGDILVLNEYNPEHDKYIGRNIKATIKHILSGGQYGLSDEYCILSIKVMDLNWCKPDE